MVTDEYGASASHTDIIATSGNDAPVYGPSPVVTVDDDVLNSTGDGSSDDPFADDDETVPDANDTIEIDASLSFTDAQNDTLEYTWTVGNLTGSIDLYVNGIPKTVSSGVQSFTGHTITISPQVTSNPDGMADFSIKISATDSGSTAPESEEIYFDLF